MSILTSGISAHKSTGPEIISEANALKVLGCLVVASGAGILVGRYVVPKLFAKSNLDFGFSGFIGGVAGAIIGAGVGYLIFRNDTVDG